jgi:hypothetical protein
MNPEPVDAKNLLIEARAKIIWGEAAESVREFLISNGMSGPEADEQIKAFSLERNREIRKLGIKNTLIGAVLIAVSGITIPFLLAIPPNHGYYLDAGRGVAILVLVGLYGLWKLTNGIIYLVRPQSEHQSITDLSD